MISSPSHPQSIRPLIERINQAVIKSSADSVSPIFASEGTRYDLIAVAEGLLFAVRTPEENLFAIAQQPAQNAALRCAIALGIPDALPADGSPCSIAELTHRTSADSTLVGRILRACASTSLLSETSEGHYAHNPVSRTLLSPANRALLTLMFDYNGRAVFALPEFLEARKWQDPGSYTDCSFMLGSRTNLPMWEYRDSDETCRRVFDLGMESEIVAALATGPASGSFPFARELAGDDALTHGPLPSPVTIVDLGGGHGQALRGIRKDHPQLSNARFVLVDLLPVIESAQANGLPSWIEPIVGSFFEPLPIREAQVYYLRRCLHNWDDTACRSILHNVAQAMNAADSRLLITDMVVDNVGAAKELAWEDLNMMTIGGIERTERHWQTLLDESGFRVHQIWRNSPTEHATIDARLK